MKNTARTIKKRLYGILDAMRHRVSNRDAEALNSKNRLLRIKARGYPNRERFKLSVMFHYEKNEYGVLNLPTTIGEDPFIYTI